jgi:hypothetical protein
VQNFASWQTAQEQFNLDAQENYRLRRAIDCIHYDLEQWDKSRDEWMDIEGSSAQMAQIAQQHGLCYIASLSGQLMKNDPNNIVRMVTYAESYMIHWFAHLENQINWYGRDQGIQNHVNFVRNVASKVKQGNSDAGILVAESASHTPTADIIYEVFQMVLDINDVTSMFSYNDQAGFDRLKTVIDCVLQDAVSCPAN